MSKIPELIKQRRLELKESQGEFAKRFNTQGNTVSRWESGVYQAPYEVIEYCFEPINIVICPSCMGSGHVIK